MKKHIAAILVASNFLFAGCSTGLVATKWEYKVVPTFKAPVGSAIVGNEIPDELKGEEALMSNLGKDGWILVGRFDGLLYFKQPIK